MDTAAPTSFCIPFSSEPRLAGYLQRADAWLLSRWPETRISIPTRRFQGRAIGRGNTVEIGSFFVVDTYDKFRVELFQIDTSQALDYRHCWERHVATHVSLRRTTSARIVTVHASATAEGMHRGQGYDVAIYIDTATHFYREPNWGVGTPLRTAHFPDRKDIGNRATGYYAIEEADFDDYVVSYVVYERGVPVAHALHVIEQHELQRVLQHTHPMTALILPEEPTISRAAFPAENTGEASPIFFDASWVRPEAGGLTRAALRDALSVLGPMSTRGHVSSLNFEAANITISEAVASPEDIQLSYEEAIATVPWRTIPASNVRLRRTGMGVLITWEYSTQQDDHVAAGTIPAEYFDIERSIDGMEWEVVGRCGAMVRSFEDRVHGIGPHEYRVTASTSSLNVEDSHVSTGILEVADNALGHLIQGIDAAFNAIFNWHSFGPGATIDGRRRLAEELAASLSQFTRTRMREDRFLRRILPPTPIDDDLLGHL